MTQAINDKKAYELFGDGIPPQSTRQRLLFTAMDLFYVHGFHAVGLDQILTEVGVTKTTFYNHFPSKDEMILEVIKMRDQWETQAFWDTVETMADGEPAKMLLAVFDALEAWFNAPDFNGCTFLNACIEYPSSNDPIHRAGARHMASIEQQLVEVATQAQATDPQEVGRQLSLLLQGTMVIRHAMSRDDAASTARRMAEGVLERYLKPAEA